MWIWLLIRYLTFAIAVAAAAALVPGITVEAGAWWAVLVMALVLATINIFIRPFLQFVSCGCLILTLGLFALVINAFTFWLASWIALNWFNVPFYVDGFWPAFWGGLVVSIVSTLLDWFANRGQESEQLAQR